MDIYRFARLEEIAPSLTAFSFELTSTETDAYNCIAWAVGDVTQWWWPTPRYGCYWPPGVPRDNTLASLIALFKIHGYEVCEGCEREIGFEKVALYEHPEFGVEHAARQLQCGHWTSKIGDWEDIKHQDPAALNCVDYGRAVCFMKRRRKDWL